MNNAINDREQNHFKLITKTENNNLSCAINSWCALLTKSWHHLIYGKEARNGSCGLIYELPNYLQRTQESFAIADMRTIPFTEPHYHTVETEIYFVLEGKGTIIVGEKEIIAAAGDVIIIPPLTAHYVIPSSNCVIAIVNTPPFNPNDYKVLTTSNDAVGYNHERFLNRTNQVSKELSYSKNNVSVVEKDI